MLLFISAAAWALLMFEPAGNALHAQHAMHGARASLALGWAVMLAAMMAPLLIAPVRHIRDRSFVRRRARAIMLFAVAYAGIWMAAGVVLLALGSWMPVALAISIALVWQFSPIKQRCLNRCQAHPALAAFAPDADLDALRFGLTHGAWCVGTCWALMLLPLVFSRAHVIAMAAVTLWLFAERLDRPMPPRWCWRGPGKAARIMMAQIRTSVERLESPKRLRT